MKFGLLSPIVIRLPGAHAQWESAAGVTELTQVARAADRLGYHHLTCSEHTGVPREVAAVRGGTYWDPLATLSFLAGQTERIALATNVLVLAYHHPLSIVKSYGTLDRLSGGRVVLGVGVGTLQQEFDLLSAPFDDRGPRADDAIRAIRAGWATGVPSYHGTHYDFDDFAVDPVAVQPRVPIWIGGRTGRSLRRAATLADGWMPFGLTLEQISAMVGALPARQDPLEVVLQPGALDPLGDPDRTRSAVDNAGAAGATIVNARFVHRDLAHLLDQMHALAELFPQAFTTADDPTEPSTMPAAPTRRRHD
ncbi:TIGR03619 family F420-dependent LLM class oxidoreductase [Nakamurella lactea]|uniref:TIGR03619 family F420-dependent LLM class oxidoreductase n=1 Tax=Nakamurella lactea TaxID=459515 RepID=UPI000427EBC0|nr:TIGR03619 family F420-dependent LLM class oxidoreductase [Nakamurella lactea]